MNSVPFALDLPVRRLAAALLVTTLAVPACGDDGDTTDTDDMTTSAGTTTGTTNNMTGTTGDMTGTTDDPTTTMGGTTTGPQGDLSHDADIQPIWDANCVEGCHAAGGIGAAWFLLTPGDAYDSIVEKPSISFAGLTHVTPGDHTTSYLWHKINGTQNDVGGGGTIMPQPPKPKLSQADIDKVAAWIDQGAMP
jgi:hypothetical protein